MVISIVPRKKGLSNYAVSQFVLTIIHISTVKRSDITKIPAENATSYMFLENTMPILEKMMNKKPIAIAISFKIS